MPDNVIRDPQVYISNESRELFDNMKRLPDFKSFDNKDFFILSMLFGYRNKKKVQLKKQDRTQSGYARERYFTHRDMDYIKALAVAETGELLIVQDIPKMFSIAEEYVNGGAVFLKEFVYENPADFIKKLANELKSK